MKLDDLSALLSTTLEKPISYFNELKRTLRQQSADLARLDSKLDAETLEHREASPAQIDFRGRPGPGGGVNVDPSLAAFFMLAAVLNAPRAQTSHETHTVWHFTTLAGSLDELDFNPCFLTRTHLFGETLQAIVSDPTLAKRVRQIQISVRGNWAQIHYDDDRVSRFARRQERQSFFSEILVLDGAIVQAVAAFLAKAHP